MNDIKKDMITWCKKREKHDNKSIEMFVDSIIERVSDTVIKEVKKVLRKEFGNKTLSHGHIVSPEYYLELKLKEVKHNLLKKQ